MLRNKLYPRVMLCLILLAVMAATSLTAQELPPQGICLYREPAPPLAALNDGTGVVTFYWTIDYATMFNRNYTLEILPPTGGPFLLESFPGEDSPINNSAIWEVPIGAPAGCYYARLTFFSDWCCGCPNKFEDQATVGFKIAPAARFRIFKFLDVNGNGYWDIDEPPLADWGFTVQLPGCDRVYDLITGPDGYTDYVSVPVEPTGVTNYEVTEDLPDGWVKTEPDGDANPFIVGLAPGCNDDVFVGNWQPITITGTKYMDCAEWPWSEPPTDLPPLPGVEVFLYDTGGQLLDQTVTDENGNYQFPSPEKIAETGQAYMQWQPGFVISENVPAPIAPLLAYNEGEPAICDSHQLQQWPGEFYATATDSPWQVPSPNFVTPTDIVMDTSALVESYQDFGGNNIYNRQPGRIFGFMCLDAIALDLTTIEVEKDGEVWPAGPCDCCTDCGFYNVATLLEEPEGLRPGDYVLTPPSGLPAGKHWVATLYYVDDNGELQKIQLPVVNGSVTVNLQCGEDLRVDFCIQTDTTGNRQCNLPVTFTQVGWKTFSSQIDPVIGGGMVFNKFPVAFLKFYFYSTTPVSDKVIIGKGTKTVSFEGNTTNLQRLCTFLPQTGTPGKLDRAYLDPWDKTSAGALAGETLALQLNIAYSDRRIMPRTPGYDLESFTLAGGLLKGKTVGQALDIANAVLAGDLPSRYGFPAATGYNDLTNVLAAINADYEFVDWNTFNDRGYLVPNVAYGTQDKNWHYANRPFSP